MIGLIIDGVILRLNELWEDNREYMSENLPQDASGVFFIRTVKPKSKAKLGTRKLLECPLDIQYFPTKEEGRDELDAIADTLFDVLELIDIDDELALPIRAKEEMSYEIVDNVLHFFVTYPAILSKRATDVDAIETYTLDLSLED